MDKIKSIEPTKKVLIVGGAVRDKLLGKEPNDIDLATNIHINKLENHFKTIDIGKNKEFGIIVINWKNQPIEIANFRKEEKYSDNRHPDKVELVNDFKTDSARRDFTINALGMDINGNIIDHHGGKKDLENKIIKTVGNPGKRFNEDALRIIRAIRFAIQLDFDIEKNTYDSIKNNKHLLKNIAQERITNELIKMASTSNFHDAIILMDKLNLLEYSLPDVKQYKKVFHNPRHHPEGNLFNHTVECLKAVRTTNPIINLAITYHDIGKLYTYEFKDNDFKYHGHDKEGIEPFKEIAKQIKLSNEYKDAIIFSIKNHMKVHNFQRGMSDYKIHKLLENKHWNILEKVAKGDCLSRGINQDKIWWRNIQNKIKKVEKKIQLGKEYKQIRRKINGYRVMELTGLKPSPKLGKVIDSTIKWILNNDVDVDNDELIDKKIIQIFNGINN